MRPDSLAERLRIITGGQSVREIAETVGMNHETVRRYLSGYAPSTEFLAQICDRYGASGSWLLLGSGPPTLDECRKLALENATEGELLCALAAKVRSVTRRVELLEAELKRVCPPKPARRAATPGGR